MNVLTRLFMTAAWCLKTGDGGPVGRAISRPFDADQQARFAFERSSFSRSVSFIGRTMQQALSNSAGMERRGYQYAFDMLGEEALTAADAEKFFIDYQTAIKDLAPKCNAPDHRDFHGISIKLSALQPRYEFTQRDRRRSRSWARECRVSRTW